MSKHKYICDCGAVFADEAGILACANNNHGLPRKSEFKVTADQIRAKLAEIDADERFHYSPALVQVNAPLALIQVSMGAEARALAWVLGVEGPKPGPRPKGK